jgi:hypothetical protein
MLKRTITLLSLTITVGALLLTLGCGGSNSNPVAPVSSDRPLVSRGGNPPYPPELYYPYDNMVIYWTASGRITFYLRAIDPNNDPVKFKIVILKDNNVVAEFGPDFRGWSKLSYASGEWARCDIPVSLLPKGTFKWQAFATDGNPGWSEGSAVRTLTNATK